jgi:hypothetical protein
MFVREASLKKPYKLDSVMFKLDSPCYENEVLDSIPPTQTGGKKNTYFKNKYYSSMLPHVCWPVHETITFLNHNKVKTKYLTMLILHKIKLVNNSKAITRDIVLSFKASTLCGIK